MNGARVSCLPAVWLVLLSLHGCSTAPSPPPPAPVPPVTVPAAPTLPEAPAAARPSSLAGERQWLQSWFGGTPVRITQRSEAAFSVDVPRDYCFDAGRSVVKPPLAAVLDKLAQSLQRKPAARVELLAAPGDAADASALAQQRADNVRKHLIARGVSSQQLAAPSTTAVAAVQLRIGLAAP
jgi:outer membrane protein OmpA-like peptidoglycan-associated protein